MALASYKLEYLRPPSEASFLNHNMNYIKSGDENDAKRRIFGNVAFEPWELKSIKDFEKLLQSNGIRLPMNWDKGEMLRYLYEAKFNLPYALEMIKKGLELHQEVKNNPIRNSVLKYLTSGVIYTFGKDIQYRPIIIMNLNRLRMQEFDEEDFKMALLTIMTILKTYCFIPRKIENWIMIIDIQNFKTDIDFAKIRSIAEEARCAFPAALEKMFIISSPSLYSKHMDAIRDLVSWSLIENVQLFSNNELSQLQSYISANCLESKYEGNLTNVDKFWPPPQPRTGSITSTNLNYSRASQQQVEAVNESAISDEYDKFGLNESVASDPNMFRVSPQKSSQKDLYIPVESNTFQNQYAPEPVYSAEQRKSVKEEYSLRGQNDHSKSPTFFKQPSDVSKSIVPKDEEILRNILFNSNSKNVSRVSIKEESRPITQSKFTTSFVEPSPVSPQIQIFKAESHQNLYPERKSENLYPERRSEQSMRSSSMMASKPLHTNVPKISGEKADNDVRSVRSNSSRQSKEKNQLNTSYEKLLTDQLEALATKKPDPVAPASVTRNSVELTVKQGSLKKSVVPPEKSVVSLGSRKASEKSYQTGAPAEKAKSHLKTNLEKSREWEFDEDEEFPNSNRIKSRKASELVAQKSEALSITGRLKEYEVKKASPAKGRDETTFISDGYGGERVKERGRTKLLEALPSSDNEFDGADQGQIEKEAKKGGCCGFLCLKKPELPRKKSRSKSKKRK